MNKAPNKGADAQYKYNINYRSMDDTEESHHFTRELYRLDLY